MLWYPLPRRLSRSVRLYGRLTPFADLAIGFFYPTIKDRFSKNALMIVNHEYTTGGDMFPNYVGGEEGSVTPEAQNQRAVEIEAHGFSIVEVALRRNGSWELVKGSPFNRRVTGSTSIKVAGPLRGHPLMQTAADPAGETVLGCLNNCAGGKTPWGTIITCEENFDQYFANYSEELDPLSARIPAPGEASRRKWELFDDRFDLSEDPNEYHRFGFCVEVDPYEPNEPPVKRTAMGRFKHEGAADVLGATPMDRPEDIEVNPKSGHVFIALTNNSRREVADEANPRVDNEHGHIIELIEDGNEATSLTFAWNIFVKCGRPGNEADYARFGDIADPVAAGVSVISDPDNLVHDRCGNLWIATDGMPFNPPSGFDDFPSYNDGIFAAPTEGPDRGLVRRFLSGVSRSEVCGPEFSGDERTFFCAIQHPNDGEAFEKVWPVGDPDGVSKPALVCVMHVNGKKIGSA